MAMKPFYQGQLDVFCALYAVLNGMKVTSGIRGLRARDILHDMLMVVSANPNVFRAILDQNTDYISVVDAMLKAQSQAFPIRVERPFADHEEPSPEVVWNTVAAWLKGGDKRAAVFRFLRFMTPDMPPMNKHWTCAYEVEDDIIPFFDCSHEPDAIYQLKATDFVTREKDISRQCLIYLQPRSIRFMASRF